MQQDGGCARSWHAHVHVHAIVAVCQRGTGSMRIREAKIQVTHTRSTVAARSRAECSCQRRWPLQCACDPRIRCMRCLRNRSGLHLQREHRRTWAGPLRARVSGWPAARPCTASQQRGLVPPACGIARDADSCDHAQLIAEEVLSRCRYVRRCLTC